jgi:hypothetical protein
VHRNPRSVLVLTTAKGWMTMYGCGWRISPRTPLDGRRRVVVAANGQNRQRQRNPRWVSAARAHGFGREGAARRPAASTRDGGVMHGRPHARRFAGVELDGGGGAIWARAWAVDGVRVRTDTSNRRRI